MKQKIEAVNESDEQGNPTGGSVTATGISITWQKGPLGRGEDRKEPNGAFVEGVIEAAAQRLEYFQQSKFACPENAEALSFLQLAMDALEKRTKARETQQVEGTHAVHA